MVLNTVIRRNRKRNRPKRKSYGFDWLARKRLIKRVKRMFPSLGSRHDIDYTVKACIAFVQERENVKALIALAQERENCA